MSPSDSQKQNERFFEMIDIFYLHGQGVKSGRRGVKKLKNCLDILHG